VRGSTVLILFVATVVRRGSVRLGRTINLAVKHTFVNLFEFADQCYLAEAVSDKGGEDLIFRITPEPHPDLDEAIEDFLGEWLLEVAEIGSGVNKGAM
jgi:hypothetical protein